MVTYRYSEDGIERLVRKATRQSLVFTSVLILVALAFVSVNEELPDPLTEIVVVGVVSASLFWAWRRAVRNIRTIVKSTEIELDQDALTARSPLGTTKLGRNEVTQILYMKDGILVRGANLRHMVQLKPDLDGFQELATRIQDWVPAGVRRTRASKFVLGTPLSLTLLLAVVAVGNLGLWFIAVSATTPAIAILCCVLEAVILIVCAAFAWRWKPVAPSLKRIKWGMLLLIFPVISLILRAYQLSQSH